jgi:hypothetical protein
VAATKSFCLASIGNIQGAGGDGGESAPEGGQDAHRMDESARWHPRERAGGRPGENGGSVDTAADVDGAQHVPGAGRHAYELPVSGPDRLLPAKQTNEKQSRANHSEVLWKHLVEHRQSLSGRAPAA